MDVEYQFVPYGKKIDPEKNTLVLDVGMKTVPGIIDHHHPDAQVECTASLVVKYPFLVLDHIQREKNLTKEEDSFSLRIITHRMPDFDAVSSIFLALKLLENGVIDSSMEKIADYAKMVDSARLPKNIDLSSTPYSILLALFRSIRKAKEQANQERINEGLKFMKFLYSKSEEGYEIYQNRVLFSGIERYERAMRMVENDYFGYLFDLSKAQKINLVLPLISEKGKKEVDGLIVKSPKSFLLKEWARRDRENSKNREGFSFLMANFTDRRYILGVDPEMGVNLRGLGDMLSQREDKKRKEEGRPLSYRWFDGNCPFFNFRIIDSPQDGASLSHEEIAEIILEFGRL